MTTRAFDTKAAKLMPIGGHGNLPVHPVEPAIDALERGIRTRARRIVYPRWGTGVLLGRMLVQRFAELAVRRTVRRSLELAREEHAPLTTPQPDAKVPAGR